MNSALAIDRGVDPLSETARAPDAQAGRNNLFQLVQLRWLAVAGQLVTIAAVHSGLGIALPLREMLGLLLILVVFNLASWARSLGGRHAVGNVELFVGLLIDVALLAGQLYFSGGITNPFVFLFLLQVAVGAVLLRPRFIWATVAVTCLAFGLLARWYQPLHYPDRVDAVLSGHFVGGLLICFVLNACLLVIFIQRIQRNLRQRDARLADLRQRAVEEEHIVRMGLLASGAAHELGTPLATLSVILGDWARMAPFVGEPELREEIEEMELQLRRCKSIVSGILMSAGETRAEALEQTRLHAFLDELVDHWRRTRAVDHVHCDRSELVDRPIISDASVKQMIDNLLDNALEAAPGAPLSLSARSDDVHGQLVITVRDAGPGFSAEMLEHFGKPYQSSKGKPGGGLGLFLSVNVARTLGGRIEARNLPEGGAEVEVRLPLLALAPATVEEGDHA